MPLSFEEKKFIITNYKIFEGYTTFARAFCKEFKKRQAPSYKTYRRIKDKFEATGSVQDQARSGRPKSVTTDEKVEEVRVLLENNPGMSIERAHLATGISVGSVHSIATSVLNLYPYRIKILHQLKSTDFGKRIEFAEWFLENPSRAHFFTATDEAYFHLDGNVNNYNFRIWSQSNPNFVVEKQLKPPKVHVWCSISSNKIIGPYFFDSKVNSENYLNMLQQFYLLEHKKQKLYKSYYFQQDGAPAHRAEIVQTWLEEQFDSKFVKKDKWPPRSPDLNPCDFFLWGYHKDKVYAKRLDSIEQLKEEIKIEISKISKITLSAVFEDMKKRCDKVLKCEGKHIE